MSFGSRLRERREALGLKQSELGKMFGITGSAIGNYENGVSFPKADILYRAFDILQCDANFLFQDEMAGTKGAQQTSSENALLPSFRQLNEEGQEKAVDYINDLVDTGKYIKIHSDFVVQEA